MQNKLICSGREAPEGGKYAWLGVGTMVWRRNAVRHEGQTMGMISIEELRHCCLRCVSFPILEHPNSHAAATRPPLLHTPT